MDIIDNITKSSAANDKYKMLGPNSVLIMGTKASSCEQTHVMWNHIDWSSSLVFMNLYFQCIAGTLVPMFCHFHI